MTKKVSTKTMEEKLIAQQQKVKKLSEDLVKAKDKLQAYTKAVNEEKEEKLRNIIANSDLSLDDAAQILSNYIASQKNEKLKTATSVIPEDRNGANGAFGEAIENATSAIAMSDEVKDSFDFDKDDIDYDSL